MQNARDVLTPDSLTMLQVIAEGWQLCRRRPATGAGAQRPHLPRSADRRRAGCAAVRPQRPPTKPTEAGAELLREGGRLLQDIDAVANRVRRVATGWEPQLTLSIDG